MRSVTKIAINSLLNRKNISIQNTVVKDLDECTIMYLHGNSIIIFNKDQKNTIEISTCGYNTNVTKERLNGLPNVKVGTKNGQLFLNGQKWDGQRTTVLN